MKSKKKKVAERVVGEGSASADDLDRMLQAIADDPEAIELYEDTLATQALLDRLVEARGRRSQKDVALRMGTTQSAVSDIETGRVDPRLSTLQRYARAVNGRLQLSIRRGGRKNADDAVQMPAAEELAEEQVLHHVLSGFFGATAEGPRTTADVAARAGLQEPTVSFAADRLLATGWLAVMPGGGKSEPRFALRESRGFALGLSIGHDTIDAVVTDLRASRLHAQRYSLTDHSPAAVVDAVARACDELPKQLAASADIIGAGVVLAGRVDGPRGTVRSAFDLQTDAEPWTDIALQSALEQATGIRVAVENDANALAVYEYLSGGDTGDTLVVLLTARGIGAGLILNGNIVHGSEGFAGEIGHVIVDPGGQPCRCGQRGCLETLASAEAIANGVRFASGRPIDDLEEASRLAEEENPAVSTVFHQAGAAVGTVIANAAATVGPSRVAIFGPRELTSKRECRSADTFLAALQGVQRTHREAPRVSIDARVLTSTTLGEAAAAAAVKHFLSAPRHWVPDVGRIDSPFDLARLLLRHGLPRQVERVKDWAGLGQRQP